MTSQQALLYHSPPSPAMTSWLAERGYTATNGLDAVHIMRAYIKHHGLTSGWSDHYKRQGGVLLSGMEQNEGESDE